MAGKLGGDQLAEALKFELVREVVVRRLLIGNHTTQDFYARQRAQYAAQIARDEQQERDEGPENFKCNIPQETVSNLGAFARLVVSSYEADAINLSDASKFLGIKAELLR